MKPSINQRWTPLRPATFKPNPKSVRDKELDRDEELYRNATHTVLVIPHNTQDGPHDPFDGWVILSVKRNDRKPECDWRIFMRIKNEIMGPDREAVQLFPGMRRVVDTANQYFLFVAPKGYVIGLGQIEQEVSDTERADQIGAVQRPFAEDDPLRDLVNNQPRSSRTPIFPMPLYPQEIVDNVLSQRGKGRWTWVPETEDGNGG